MMRVLLDVKGMSQHSEQVNEAIRGSACGPVTTYVILNKVCDDPSIRALDVNTLYKILGGTKIGLFKWRLVKNLRKLLGPTWEIANCSISEAIQQLRQGNPVALRFDIYFSRQFLHHPNPLFRYHWVPLIGYEIKNDELYLMIHDNGTSKRDSQIRTFKYDDQRQFLRFVKIQPPMKKID